MSFFKQIRLALNFFAGTPKRKALRKKKAKPKPKKSKVKKKKTKTEKKPRLKKIALRRRGRQVPASVPAASAVGLRRRGRQVPTSVPAASAGGKGGPKKIMVGEVTHYFDRAKAGAFMITGAPIAMGDLLEFRGRAGSFRQKVTSLQINRVPVPSARAGDEVGLLVKKPVREGDYVFKINGA